MSATMVPSAIALGGSESAAASSPDRDVSKGLLLKQHESPSSRTTDETLSTSNCDDSLTASTSAAEVRLYAPPVTAVNVDRRSVRQRMRDQEAKINALLHKPTAAAAAPADGVLMKLVQTLEADLKKAQDQTRELQDTLDALQAAKEVVRDSSETKEAVDNIPEAQRIADLEVQLRRKTNEACLLQDRWQNTLRRMVQYQVDLEQHDLHFTDYAEQHFQLADDALKELKGLTQKDQPPATRQVGKKAKLMMSTLLKDLEVLGERYTDARVNQEEQLADLRVAQVEWQRRAEYLESVCTNHDIDLQEEYTPQSSFTNPAPMAKLFQKLGLENTEDIQSQQELQAEVKVAEEQTKQAQLERDVLEQEVARLNQTVSKLQNATKIQQEGLQKAQQAAADAAARAAVPKKKRKGLFMKTKKTPPPPPPPPLPIVDVSAVLLPMDGESQRFDMFHERLQSQTSALNSLQQDYRRVARQKAQLQHTVKELRVEQEQDKAASENRTLKEMQLQMDQLVAKRLQEQEQAQSTIDELRARLAALEAKEVS